MVDKFDKSRLLFIRLGVLAIIVAIVLGLSFDEPEGNYCDQKECK